MKRIVDEASSDRGGSGTLRPRVLTWPPPAEDLDALEVFELRGPAELTVPTGTHHNLPARPGARPPSAGRPRLAPGHGAPVQSSPAEIARSAQALVWPPPSDADLEEPTREAVTPLFTTGVNEMGFGKLSPTAIPMPEAAQPNVGLPMVALASASDEGLPPSRGRRIGRAVILGMAAIALVTLGGTPWITESWKRAASVNVPPRASLPANGPAAFAPSPTIPAPDGEAGIREALASYRAAFDNRDASAARRIWPNADEAALARAFADLTSQRLEFDACHVAARPDSATATCEGRVVSVSRVGPGDPQVEARRWQFTLRATPAGWRIEQVIW